MVIPQIHLISFQNLVEYECRRRACGVRSSQSTCRNLGRQAGLHVSDLRGTTPAFPRRSEDDAREGRQIQLFEFDADPKRTRCLRPAVLVRAIDSVEGGFADAGFRVRLKEARYFSVDRIPTKFMASWPKDFAPKTLAEHFKPGNPTGAEPALQFREWRPRTNMSA